MAGDKSELSDLFALLLHLKTAYSAFFAMVDSDPGCEVALGHMKAAARAFHHSLEQACRAGKTVILHTERGGGRTHFIRTVGPLNADGITFRYSSERGSSRHLYQCVIVAITWVDAVPDARCAEFRDKSPRVSQFPTGRS